jgi:hypothetical protein
MLIDNPLNSSTWSFPILECFHIVGFAVAIGSVAIVDFRLLGLGLRHTAPGQLTKETGILTFIGLTTAVFSGMLLYSTDPDKYYLNWSFVIKMTCLLLAIIFHYSIHRRIIYSSASPPVRKVVACISIVLWVSVVFGGMFIAFVDEGLSLSSTF